MAERRTITDFEKAQEALRVLQNKIERLGEKAQDYRNKAAAVGEEIAPLVERRTYLLQDPVLDDATREQYRFE